MITITKECIDLIKHFERFMPNPYHGAGDPDGLFTIGYGTTIYPSGKRVTLLDQPITEAQAVEYLMYDVRKKTAAVYPLLRDDLSNNQFAAIVSFCYNCGEGNFNASTLRKKIEANPMDTEIRNELMKWVHGVGGKVLPGLVTRRKAEADLYFTI